MFPEAAVNGFAAAFTLPKLWAAAGGYCGAFQRKG
jgi:hypothetical protein